MQRTKTYLPFPLFILSTIIVGLGVWYTTRITVQVAEPISINELVATGSATLEASPAPANLTLGQELTLDINVHSGTDKVTSVKLDMSYDDSKLEIQSLIGTDYLPVVTVPANIAGNKVTATYSVPTGQDGKADWGTVAKIKFKAIALGTQTISFTESSDIKTTGFPSGALTTITPIVIRVHNIGDINKDKYVNLLDYNLFVTDFGKSGSYSADLDGSGQVNMNDYTLFTANYGKISP